MGVAVVPLPTGQFEVISLVVIGPFVESHWNGFGHHATISTWLETYKPAMFEVVELEDHYTLRNTLVAAKNTLPTVM